MNTSTSTPTPLATAAAAAAPPSLLTQVGMAGSAAVITVTFIHPIDVIKVGSHHHGRRRFCLGFDRVWVLQESSPLQDSS